MEDWSFYFQPWGGWAAALLLIAVAALCIIVFFRKATVPLTRKGTRTLLFFRFAALAVMLIPVIRISIISLFETQVRHPLYIAVDSSLSMSLKNSTDAPSRWEMMRGLLEKSADRLTSLSDKYVIHWHSFDSALHPFRPENTPEGSSTAIGNVIKQWRSKLMPAEPSSMLILSDGVNNRGSDPLEIAGKLSIENRPIYAIGIGEKAGSLFLTDASVEDLILPDDVASDQQFIVEAMLKLRGLAGALLEVDLWIDGKIVETKEISVQALNVSKRISFTAGPIVPGNHLITVQIRPTESESSSDNNDMSAYLKVHKGTGRILYIESRLRFEYLFLKRTLAEIKGIEFDIAIVRGIGAFDILDDPNRIMAYDSIIIGDVPASVLGTKVLASIAHRVKTGGSLLLLGGLSTYGPGGYGGTPIEELLPFRISERDRQVMKPTPFLPTVDGSKESFLQVFSAPLSYKLLLKEYGNLPHLTGYVKVGALKPASSILAVSNKGDTLLAATTVQQGRVLALTVDTTFHWAFNKLSGKEDTRPYYDRFWRRLILHLSGAEEEKDYRVSLSADRTTVRPGETLLARVEVTDKNRKPVKDAVISVLLVNAEGKTVPANVNRDKEGWKADIPFERDGHYTIEAVATKEGKRIGTDRLKVLATVRNRETANLDTDFDLLEAIALHSGGRFAPIAQADAIFMSLLNNAEEYKSIARRHSPIWASPWVFLVALLFLALEWIYRRRKGLP